MDACICCGIAPPATPAVCEDDGASGRAVGTVAAEVAIVVALASNDDCNDDSGVSRLLLRTVAAAKGVVAVCSAVVNETLGDTSWTPEDEAATAAAALPSRPTARAVRMVCKCTNGGWGRKGECGLAATMSYRVQGGKAARAAALVVNLGSAGGAELKRRRLMHEKAIILLSCFFLSFLLFAECETVSRCSPSGYVYTDGCQPARRSVGGRGRR